MQIKYARRKTQIERAYNNNGYTPGYKDNYCTWRQRASTLGNLTLVQVSTLEPEPGLGPPCSPMEPPADCLRSGSWIYSKVVVALPEEPWLERVQQAGGSGKSVTGRGGGCCRCFEAALSTVLNTEAVVVVGGEGGVPVFLRGINKSYYNNNYVAEYYHSYATPMQFVLTYRRPTESPLSYCGLA